MFGCASFSGTDYRQHTTLLGYLQENSLSEEHLMPIPIVDSHIKIQDIGFDQEHQKDKQLSNPNVKLPTLLQGYLKLGAKVSDSVVIDPSRGF